MSVVTATPPAGIANVNQPDGRNVLLSVRNVSKVYGSREAVTHALDDVSFDIREGEFVGVMGPSGSGKSTLLNCISTIDTVTSGNIILNGLDITQLRSRQLSKFRRDDLGFIFQDANLLDTLTGFENIALALTIKGEKADAVRVKVERTATLLGVTDVLQKYPRQMSGGQRQRVAAARAIVADPKLVLADEPTGALDSRNTAVLLETLDVLNTKLHATIMMVTHDAVAASYADRILFIKDGKLFNELRRGDGARTDFYQRILEVQAFLSGKQGDSSAVGFVASHVTALGN
ncbi:ABC transporter ATP-binding protein [uncultured Ellagibacter sp.]|uniref:ABC transporter ATP-binding protein n=1 Tax=uncultured Ellagibacter sp. TaxID=2137580 RepID=UPI002605CD58|nr:ABC transporter ATP-binding protein [uncultured Ellagibacter sp.]